ncbi:hypothetical protein BpHYR1_043533 [Brachionus plicatilis]|uniref:Uncharacterized protein n=1 Tax=Brachionus plicatilis TaxID=10195 RepID=A0A3M7RRM9_BRAPC|nr:hypothetical protein BpHYR1_043533 [Brachionus plicatilis]
METNNILQNELKNVRKLLGDYEFKNEVVSRPIVRKRNSLQGFSKYFYSQLKPFILAVEKFDCLADRPNDRPLKGCPANADTVTITKKDEMITLCVGKDLSCSFQPNVKTLPPSGSIIRLSQVQYFYEKNKLKNLIFNNKQCIKCYTDFPCESFMVCLSVKAKSDEKLPSTICLPFDSGHILLDPTE